MIKPYHFNLDVSAIPTQLGALKQNNTNSMKFVINIVDNGSQFDITGATNATITFRRPDGTLSNSDATIMPDKSIEYVLEPNAVNMPGVYEAELQVFENIIDGGGKMLVTGSFYYQVVTALANDEGVTSQPDYPILVTLINDVSNLEQAIQVAEANRVSAESARVLAESTRVSNELTRITQESSRVSSFAAIYQQYLESISSGSVLEVVNARNGFANLDARLDDSDTKKANLNGGNAFTGNQKVSNSSGFKSATTGGTEKNVAVIASDNNLYIGDSGVGTRIEGDNLTLPPLVNNLALRANTTTGVSKNLAYIGGDNKATFGSPDLPTMILGSSLELPAPTVTTITSGFASGFTGGITVRKGLGNLCEMNISTTKSTVINTFGEILITLPVGIRPITRSLTLALGLNSGGGVVIGGYVNVTVNTNGEISIANPSNLAGVQAIIDLKITYYTA